MKKRPLRQTILFVTVFFEMLVICGCALSTYISRIVASPEMYSTPVRVTSDPSPASATPMPQSTATIEVTLIPAATITPSPTQTPSPTPTPCLTGQVLYYEMPSVALEKPMPVSIYLPPCYDQQGNYPVIYLLHGQAQTDQLWIDLGATAIADQAIQNGQTPFIMVFPYEELNFDNNATSKFPEAVIDELIPWVDANFATCTERACRSIGGISRGGGWAIKLALRNFDLFGTLGAHSFGLMYGDSSWVEVNLRTHTTADFPRIYLDRGDKDMLADDIEYFVKTLLSYNVDYEYHIYPGDHTLSYWRDHVQEYMNFYMAFWPTPFLQP